jgi:UDP-2-acetamido-3-amino-2,3-dideoxy-glucuronate N-acetyltransferase
MSKMIHPTAEVSQDAHVGEGTSIWHQAQIRGDVTIGTNCIIGKGVYIDAGVRIGNNVKIQNYASVYHGVTLEHGVFVGPHVCFTNDLRPRAVNPDGSLKAADDWNISPTLIRQGAALGANSTIVCGITIGEWAMIGSGSVVTRAVPNYGLVYGNPARLHGFVCPCGGRLEPQTRQSTVMLTRCPDCGRDIEISMQDWERISK